MSHFIQPDARCTGGGQRQWPCTREASRCTGGGQREGLYTREASRCTGGGQRYRPCTREASRCTGGGQRQWPCTREASRCTGGGQREWPCTREASRCTRSDRNQPSSSPPRPRTSNIPSLLEIEEGYKTGKLQDLINLVFDVLEYHSGTVGFAVFEDTKQDTKSA